MQHVSGYCPSCGRPSLFLIAGQIRCEYADCPEQQAVQSILSDPEVLHVARFHPNRTFTVRHPLIERLDNRLMECEVFDLLHAALQYSSTETEPEPGDYRVALVEDGSVKWERV